MKALLTLSLLLSTAGMATELKDEKNAAACNEALKSIVIHASSMAKQCAKDQDCAAHYISGDSCARAIVLRKDVKAAEDKKLLNLQNEVRKACAGVWANRAACAPAPSAPICRDKICIDKLSLGKRE
jgi:hypothetical protein